ncbi:hypothetical protein FACS1894201_04790 [Bacteroidia bacterium]|nr:hypothetical protein FACS1894201_04790 [Bacteroidia bacterium]
MLLNLLKELLKKVKLQLQLYKSGHVVSITRCKSASYGGGGKIVKITRKDCLFPLYIRRNPFYSREVTSDEWLYVEIFCGGVYDISVEAQPVCIIDAGANIGLASVYFANRYPTATIIAIEPELENYKMLVQNTKDYSNIIPLQAALWNTITELNLFNPGFTGAGSSSGFMVGADSAQQQLNISVTKEHLTKTITIDKILEDYKIQTVDILKMDIEGAEKEVFENSETWIKNMKSIIVELHDRLKDGCSRAFYNNTNGFDHEWQIGENIFLTRGNYITSKQ